MLGIVLAMKDISVSPSQLQQLADELSETAKTLPMPFDGLGRIGELSGQISADEWNEILGSTDELKKKPPELTKASDCGYRCEHKKNTNAGGIAGGCKGTAVHFT